MLNRGYAPQILLSLGIIDAGRRSKDQTARTGPSPQRPGKTINTATSTDRADESSLAPPQTTNRRLNRPSPPTQTPPKISVNSRIITATAHEITDSSRRLCFTTADEQTTDRRDHRPQETAISSTPRYMRSQTVHADIISLSQPTQTTDLTDRRHRYRPAHRLQPDPHRHNRSKDKQFIWDT